MRLPPMGNLFYTCEFLSEFSGNKWVGQKTVLPSIKETVEKVVDTSFVNCESVKLVRYSRSAGVNMSEWQNTETTFQSDSISQLVKPPFLLVALTCLVAFISMGCVFVSSALGYVVAVASSLIGGLTALRDQKLRGNANYISYPSFRPMLRVARLFTLAIAILHIVLLAIDAANGGGFF